MKFQQQEIECTQARRLHNYRLFAIAVLGFGACQVVIQHPSRSKTSPLHYSSPPDLTIIAPPSETSRKLRGSSASFMFEGDEISLATPQIAERWAKQTTKRRNRNVVLLGLQCEELPRVRSRAADDSTTTSASHNLSLLLMVIENTEFRADLRRQPRSDTVVEQTTQLETNKVILNFIHIVQFVQRIIASNLVQVIREEFE